MTVTVLLGPERRRRWSTADKLRIVEESLGADATVAEIARRHGIHPNQLHTWRGQAARGLLTSGLGGATAQERMERFVPVAIRTGDSIRNATREDIAGAGPLTEVVLRNGRVLRLADGVPPTRAAVLADALEGPAR